MTDNRKSGIALIAGSLGGIITMAIHPTAGGALTPAQFERLAVLSAVAHSLAMISFLLLFLGACGLTLRLAHPDRLAFSALVIYGFAAVAVLIATAVSGFIVPNIMRHMVRDVPAAAPQWRIVIDSVFQINQAFARIFTVAASASMALWSAAALRNGGLARVGHLRLDVHGMAIVVLCQTIWFVCAGVELYRQRLVPSPDLT
jgi:hypothetical protein